MGREKDARWSSVNLPSLSWLLQLTALSLCSSDSMNSCEIHKKYIVHVYTEYNIIRTNVLESAVEIFYTS